MLCLFVQVLVDALHCRINVPTVLQSLGCLAQQSVSTFEAQAEEITQFIYQNIFQVSVCEIVHLYRVIDEILD